MFSFSCSELPAWCSHLRHHSAGVHSLYEPDFPPAALAPGNRVHIGGLVRVVFESVAQEFHPAQVVCMLVVNYQAYLQKLFFRRLVPVWQELIRRKFFVREWPSGSARKDWLVLVVRQQMLLMNRSHRDSASLHCGPLPTQDQRVLTVVAIIHRGCRGLTSGCCAKANKPYA